MLRDERYYHRLEKQLEMEHGYLYTYYKDGELQGYMVCYLESSRIVIDEIIYALQAPICFCIKRGLIIVPAFLSAA